MSTNHSSSTLTTTLSLFTTTMALHTLYTKAFKKYDPTSNNNNKGNKIMTIVSQIYDKAIVHMTSKWYNQVLTQQSPNTTILDVGIGTASALLSNSDIIRERNLRIIGLDYNSYYIHSAQDSIKEANLSEYISVHCCDLYASTSTKSPSQFILEKFNTQSKGEKFDAVYFSGSFSLLPDPKKALEIVSQVLKPDTGRIYITQTYQRHTPPFMSLLKPMIKYVTTIDFGQLITEKDIVELLFERCSDIVEVMEHGVIEGSLDNYWQAAYLTVLKVKENHN